MSGPEPASTLGYAKRFDELRNEIRNRVNEEPTCPICGHTVPIVTSRYNPQERWARHTTTGSLTSGDGPECGNGDKPAEDSGVRMATVDMRPMTDVESNLMTQVLTLRRQVGGVRRLHQQYRPAFGDSDVCAHCTRGMDLVYWPCPTIQALDKLTSIIGEEPR